MEYFLVAAAISAAVNLTFAAVCLYSYAHGKMYISRDDRSGTLAWGLRFLVIGVLLLTVFIIAT